MTRYLAGRVVAGLVSLFLFVTAIFFAARWLIPRRRDPGDPSATDEYLELLDGLDSGDF